MKILISYFCSNQPTEIAKVLLRCQPWERQSKPHSQWLLLLEMILLTLHQIILQTPMIGENMEEIKGCFDPAVIWYFALRSCREQHRQSGGCSWQRESIKNPLVQGSTGKACSLEMTPASDLTFYDKSPIITILQGPSLSKKSLVRACIQISKGSKSSLRFILKLQCNSLFGLPRFLSGKESTCQCRRRRFNPWVRKTPWRKEWHPLQYSCLGNPMHRGAWQATLHGDTKELDTT